MRRKTTSIGKAITGVVAFSLIGKLMGFIREITLSYYFGATGVSDAYLISQTIPGTIFQFVGTGLATCYIPVYYRVIVSGREKGDDFSNRILTIVFAFSTFVIAVIWLWPEWIVRLFASGFSPKTMYYATWFTRIGVLSLYFSSMIYVFNSYLQANQVFTITAFAAVPNSVAIIASIILGEKINIWLVSIGSTLAVGVQLLFLLPAIWKLHYRPRLDMQWNEPNVAAFFKLLAPVILGISVNEINTLVDRTLASRVAEGGISALTYANSLVMLIQGCFVQSAVNVYYPSISKAVASGEEEQAVEMLRRAMGLILCLLVPAVVGIVMYSRPLVELLFGRGAFDDRAVTLTKTAVTYYALGLCFMGVRELLSRFYYANRNTKLPMKNAAIGVCINIVLNIILSKYMGLGGLALATSLSAGITAGLLWLQMKYLSHGNAKIIDAAQIGKSCVATVLMAAASYACYVCVPGDSNIRLFAAIIVGIVVYLISAIVMKIDALSGILEGVKNVWK